MFKYVKPQPFDSDIPTEDDHVMMAPKSKINELQYQILSDYDINTTFFPKTNPEVNTAYMSNFL